MAPAVPVLVLALASLGLAMSVARQEQELAQNYLTKFGYLRDRSSDKFASLVSIDSAVKDFQAFAGLEQTGELDDETMVMMKTPRCGVKDVIQEDVDTPRMRLKLSRDLERDKRYALQGSRWKVKDLTYRVSKYPVRSGLSRRQVDETMEKAFKIWEKATPLKFTKQNSGKVHIEIRFERRSHGDDDPFDGEGGTLAHAFFPVFGGDAHFDDDEDWTVNTARGTSLLMTASHELGHSLGLSHSNVRSSLMAPFYRGYESNLELESDDVKGIQALYGENTDTSRNEVGVRSLIPSRNNNDIPSTTRRTTQRTTTTRRTFVNTRTTPSSDSGTSFLCSRGQLDTLVTMKDSVTYAFLGSQYWKLTETSVEPGYPRSISSDWDSLPGNLDASFTWTNGKTYFFKGSKYWRFSDVGQMDAGYPKELDKGFSGIPNDVDAAFVWPVNNKIYFFKDSIYWKFDPDSSPPVDPSYPRPISNWDGIPNNVDSALQYSNGKSYFFKDGRYYRFDDKKFTLDTSANPPFPRETGFWWFGCPANSVRLTKQEDVGWADVSLLE